LSSTKWKKATLVSHLAFVALTFMILSNETFPSFERYWQTHDGNPANFSNNTCAKTQVPDLTNIAAIMAEAVLRDASLDFVYLDQTTNVRVNRLSPDTEVLRQSIRMGTELCMGQEVELFIDDSATSAPGATSLVPEGQTDADGEMTTTTIPAKSSTTTPPKASSTTTP
jgi:beta-lactam-binding protein with PASTA domain